MTRRKRILVVEDEPLILLFLAEVLKDEFDVITESDGHYVMRKAVEHSPDLITLDIVLGEHNGLEILRELKKCDLTKKIPVVIITGSRTQEMVDTEYIAALVLKPFDVGHVIQVIHTQLQRSGFT